MKKRSLVMFMFFLLISFIHIKATDFNGSKTTASLILENGGSSSYTYNVIFNIGNKYHASQEESEKSRTQYEFDLSSLSNATIESVSLNYSIYDYSTTSHKFKITDIDGYTSAEDIYDEIDDGTVLFDDVLYSSGSDNLSDPDLTTLVDNKKGSTMYLGAYSQNEITTGSYASLDLTLAITYSTPLTITVDNNFTASNETRGIVEVNGANRTAPHTHATSSGQSVTLKAITPQTDNEGFQRIWHTGSSNPSKWERNGVPKTNNITYSFTAT